MSKLCATLDLSRGLRVDERNDQKSPFVSCKSIGPDEGSAVVYCDDPARVREGFAIALRLMRMMPVDTRVQPEDSEDGG